MRRRQVMGGDEEPADVRRYAGQMLYRGICREIGTKRGEIEAARPDHTREGGMQHRQAETFHRSADDLNAIERFDAGGASGEDADRAGRRDRGDGSVPPTIPLRLEPAAAIRREQAPLRGELAGAAMGVGLYECRQ